MTGEATACRPQGGAGGDGGFDGFGPDALAFLHELHLHNDRTWFEAHRDRHERALRRPMAALLSELEGLFGPAQLFRAHRDLRFSRDRRPYQESVAGSLGGRHAPVRRSVHLDLRRLRVAAGVRKLEGEHRTAYRRAASAAASGTELAALVRELEERGLRLEGRTLAHGPRGVAADHPRLELLKHTRLLAVREYPVGPWLQDPATVLDRVVAPLADAEPLVRWLQRHLSPSGDGR